MNSRWPRIADRLGYSSGAYLSAQFKSVTGMTPSHFRRLRIRSRRPLDPALIRTRRTFPPDGAACRHSPDTHTPQCRMLPPRPPVHTARTAIRNLVKQTRNSVTPQPPAGTTFACGTSNRKEMMTKRIFPVTGMSCAACAARVGKTLGAQQGVRQAAVNFAAATVAVEYDPDRTSPELLAQAVAGAVRTDHRP